MKKGFKIALVVLLMMGLVLATGCSSNDGKEKVYYVGTNPHSHLLSSKMKKQVKLQA